MSAKILATTISLTSLWVASIAIATPAAKHPLAKHPLAKPSLGSPAPIPVRVYTDRRPVQACLPLDTGELLVATRGGLVRLDRQRRVQQTLTRVTGLPGTRVYALLFRGARLIVATEGGVALVARDSRGALRVTARQPGREVRALAVQGDRLILGTWGAGVQALPLRAIDAGRLPKAQRLTTTVPTPRLRVTTLYAHNGDLLVGSAGRGLWVLPKAGRSVAPHLASARLPSPFVWAVAIRRGHLVVATLAGLVEQRSDKSHPWHVLSSADVRALVPDRNGALLVAGFGHGIGRLESSATATIRWSAEAGAYITALGHSAETICGGGERGAFELAAGAPLSQVKHVKLGENLAANNVTAVTRIADKLYVGSFDQGLSVLDTSPSIAGYRPPHRVPGVDKRVDALIAQVLPDRSQRLWIGTARGLYRLDIASGALRHFGRADGLPHKHVHSLLALRDGRVVAGTGRGLAILSGPKGDRVDTINLKQGLPVASVWALAETHEAKDHLLWVGTSRGLYRWSLTRRRYQRFSVASGQLTDDWVTALAVKRDVVYVGTYNAGIVRLSPEAPSSDPKAVRYKATSLGGGWINFAGLRLLEHQGRTWLLAATMKGVEAAPLETKPSEATPQAHALDRPAALGRDVTALLPSVDGKQLWIASRRGLVRQPLTILPRPQDPDGC